jgi:hypothetical protein
LRIVESVVINGPGSGQLTIDANNLSRAFYVFKPGSDINVTISGMTVSHGFAAPGKSGSALQNNGELVTLSDMVVNGSKPESGVIANLGGSLTLQNTTISGNTGGATGAGAIYSHAGALTLSQSTISGNGGQNGGGVLSVGDHSVTITDTVISGNTASNRGGGLDIKASAGNVTLSHSVVSGNTAAQSGGGMAVLSPTQPLTVSDSTIGGNTASYAGGGIFFYRGTSAGTLTIERTTISGNQAAGSHDGGAVFLYRTNAELMIRNSTIAGNKAGRSGGGLFLKGPFGASQNIDLVSATIASNSAVTSGGNIEGGSSASTVVADDSIFAGGSAATGPDIHSNAADILLSYSLIQNDTGATLNGASTHNLLNVDPQLTALAANGGPNDTMAISGTSPAIDAGHNDAGLTTDQRGTAYPRPAFAGADMGAFEYQGPSSPAPTSGVFTVPPYETRFLRGSGTVTMSDKGILYLISGDAIVGSSVALPSGGRVNVNPTFVAGDNGLVFSGITTGTQFSVTAVDAITITQGSAAVAVSGKSAGPMTFSVYAGDTLLFSQDGTLQSIRVADAQVGGVVGNGGVTGLTLNPPSVKIDGVTPHLNGARLDTALFSALGTTESDGSVNTQGSIVLTTTKGQFAYAPTSITVNPTADAVRNKGSGNLQVRVGTLVVNLIPTVIDQSQLIGALTSLTGRSTIIQRASDGHVQLQPTGLIFIGLPDTQLQASSQPAGLSANGRYAELVSSSGQLQRIYSAFYDTTQLAATLHAVDTAATLSIQPDGIASVTLAGEPLQFIPDWQLLPTPYVHLQDRYWLQDGKICLGYSNLYYQSFTVMSVAPAH